jgi:hypothetical protein
MSRDQKTRRKAKTKEIKANPKNTLTWSNDHKKPRNQEAKKQSGNAS